MNKITEVLNILKELELKIAELYSSCSGHFPKLKEFWSELEREEKKHAKYIQNMLEVYLQNPADFIEARPFNIIAVKTVIKGVEENIVNIENNKIDQLRALNIALDIEKSLLEAKFMEYLKTDDARYNNYMKGIAGETFQHRKKIESKILQL